MNYRMLVLDLDDTLLKDDRTVSELTRRRLLEAQQQGMIVCSLPAVRRMPCSTWQKNSALPSTAGISFRSTVRASLLVRISTFCSVWIFPMRRCASCLTWRKSTASTFKPIPRIIFWFQKTTNIHKSKKKLPGWDDIECADFKAEIPKTAVKAMMLEHPDRLKEVEKALRPVVENELYRRLPNRLFGVYEPGCG